MTKHTPLNLLLAVYSVLRACSPILGIAFKGSSSMQLAPKLEIRLNSFWLSYLVMESSHYLDRHIGKVFTHILSHNLLNFLCYAALSSWQDKRPHVKGVQSEVQVVRYLDFWFHQMSVLVITPYHRLVFSNSAYGLASISKLDRHCHASLPLRSAFVSLGHLTI